MFNHFLMLCKNTKWYDINRILQKAVFKKKLICYFNYMKDKKRIEFMSKVIERVNCENPAV